MDLPDMGEQPGLTREQLAALMPEAIKEPNSDRDPESGAWVDEVSGQWRGPWDSVARGNQYGG